MVTLQKQFRSEKETAIEALDDIQNFIEKMEVFQEVYPGYDYEINIKKPTKLRTNVKWIIELNIIKDEHPQDHQRIERLT